MTRVVITGKGGVGKTTLTAAIARRLAASGASVLAVDADPQLNLAAALSVPDGERRAIVPLSRNRDLVEEKTGARPELGYGVLFRVNPDLSDIVGRFAVPTADGVQLLVMGGVETAGAGCLCPEVSLLSGVIGEVALRDGEVILVDTQAGVEHFGRSLARGFSDAIVVTDPTRNGVEAATTAARMASQLGIGRVHLVVNRVRSPLDRARVEEYLASAGVAGGPAFASVHELPYDESVLDADPSTVAFLEQPRLGAVVDGLVAALALEAPACAS